MKGIRKGVEIHFFELYNFIHLSNIMSSRNEINCGCMGPSFNPQESLFLMRKK